MSTTRIRGAAVAVAPRPDLPRRRSANRRRRARAGVLFVAPFLLLFAFIYAAPMVYAIYQSFFTVRSSGLGLGAATTVFVGLANFGTVIGDPAYWLGLGRVLLFGVVQVPVMMLAALGLALLFDSIAVRGVGVFRIFVFLPYAVPGVVSALMWSYLYLPTLSPISAAFAALGVPVDFLGKGSVLWSMANISTWAFTGVNALILFSALKAIPRELYEAARIDGASEWTIARRIKLPALRNAVTLTVILSIIGTIQLFTEPTILQNITSAINSKYTPTMYAFNAAFSASDFGTAGAASIVLSLLAGILSIVYYRFSARGAR